MNEPDLTPADHDSKQLQMQTEWDAAYRSHIATTIKEYITERGKLLPREAFREVCSVTGRTPSTVKNWLSYESNLPDLASTARIVRRWNIPLEKLFPRELLDRLPGQSDRQGADIPLLKELEAFDLIPSSRGTAAFNALQQYTDHPEESIWVRQLEGDNEQIRLGELVLVDPTIEDFANNAFYLLRVGHGSGKAPKVCIRFIRRMIGTPTVRLSRVDKADDTSAEFLPFENDRLPDYIVILGKVCIHASKTP